MTRPQAPRLLCFYVPLFPLAARLRSEPELAQEAVAIVDGNGAAAHVLAATRRARKAGIRAGQSLAQARAILPRLIARGRDRECERSAQEALLEVAERFSPRVEDGGEGIAFADTSGVEHHYRKRPDDDESADSPEPNLAQAALHAATSAHLPARVGIASSKLAARIAAELPETPTIIPTGDEAAFLAPLPVTRLAPEMRIAATLDAWGIRSIGELARLPEAEIASRLGELGRDLHVAARGVDPRPLIVRLPPPAFIEGMELEWPLVAVEPFLFVANAALGRLVERLARQGFSCRALELTLKLESAGLDVRKIDFPAPTREIRTLLTLTRLSLDERPPGAPVVGFRFVAEPDRPRRAQLSLFGPPALSPDKVAMMLSKVASVVGADRVGSPATVDAYAPERFRLAAFDPPPPPDMRRQPKPCRGILAVRVLRPPAPLEVDLASPDGKTHVGLRTIRSVANSPFVIEGSVRVASGPWRLEEAWWSDTTVTREYWDVELVTGGVYRIFRDGEGKWFADGCYD